ncbi:acyltransferase family protein [Candidatus Dojkabacteria bacterium]|nr:acyltransferase family protein [Candidatus Dojkabacteria bacterium]
MRNKTIDVLKGVGIIFVIMGHSNSAPIGNSIIAYIYTFHMPLFFWITGYLAYGRKQKEFLEYLVHKIRKIYIPYTIFFCLSLIYGHIIVRYIFGQYIIPFNLKDTLIVFFYSSEWLNHIPTFNLALWYLPVLFFTSIVFYFVIRLKDIRLIILFTIVIAIITVPVQSLLPPGPVLGIDVIPASLTFMCAGYLFKHFEAEIKISPFFLLPMFAFTLWYAYNYSGHIADLPNYLFFISALLSIFIYYRLAQDLSRSSLLAFWGESSLIIYGLHSLVNHAYPYTKIPDYYTNWEGLAVFLLNLLFTLMVCSLIYLVLKQLRSFNCKTLSNLPKIRFIT